MIEMMRNPSVGDILLFPYSIVLHFKLAIYNLCRLSKNAIFS